MGGSWNVKKKKKRKKKRLMGLLHKRNKGVSVCFNLCKNHWLLSWKTWVLDLLVYRVPLGKTFLSLGLSFPSWQGSVWMAWAPHSLRDLEGADAAVLHGERSVGSTVVNHVDPTSRSHWLGLWASSSPLRASSALWGGSSGPSSLGYWELKLLAVLSRNQHLIRVNYYWDCCPWDGP